MQLMTQAQFATHRGVTKAAVSNWKRDGLLVLVEDPADHRIKVDVSQTEAVLAARRDPMRGRPPVASNSEGSETLPPAEEGGAQQLSLPTAPAGDAGGGARSLADERIAQVREQRIGNALKNAQLAGELVLLIEADRRVAEGARACRERMHAWLRSVAERFAAERDVRAIMAIGEEGIDQIFEELANQAGRGEFAGDDEEDEPTAEELAELDAAASASEA